MSVFFKVSSSEEINQLSYEELKTQRRDSLAVLAGIILPAAILSLTAIWLEWSPLLQSAMLVAMLLCLPAIITTSRMSKRFHELKSEQNKKK